MSYFHMGNPPLAAPTLSSALFRFTTEFGMGSGGSKMLCYQEILFVQMANDVFLSFDLRKVN